MALLGKVDSEQASYLDLAGFLSHHGSEDGIEADLQELFARVLFNVAVANRDDHLRNHGFMHSREGWRLAPAFDMNPSAKKFEHVLAIDASSPLPDLNTAMATAPMYRLTPSQAQATLARLRQVLGAWEVKAKLLGLSAEDRLELKDCFQV
jgi:serine/threonine-protein kinase HipA